MYEEVDKDKVRRIVRELLEALGDGSTAPPDGPRGGKPVIEPDVYTTVEVARQLGVSAAWVTAHVDEFPGVFRLSEGQRANYRFPRSSIEEYKRKHAI